MQIPTLPCFSFVYLIIRVSKKKLPTLVIYSRDNYHNSSVQFRISSEVPLEFLAGFLSVFLWKFLARNIAEYLKRYSEKNPSKCSSKWSEQLFEKSQKEHPESRENFR